LLREADRALKDGEVSAIQSAKPAPDDQGRLQGLLRLLREAAAELGLEPEILASRRELLALIRGDDSVRPLHGWRRTVVGDALLRAL
jgi:ribonuclease D